MYKKVFVSCVNVAAKHSFANVVAGLVPANVVTRPWRAICLSFFFLLAVHYPLLTVLNAEDAEIKLNSNDGSTSLIIQDNTGIVVSSFTSDGNAYFGGKVGIGRNDPTTHLDVAGDVRMKSDDSGSFWRNLSISGASSSKLTLDPWNYNIAASLHVEGPLSLAFVGTTSEHPFNIRTNNLDRITIDTTGNVGIGTTNPSVLLNIAGNVLVSTLTTNPILYVSTFTGNVGIGTKNPLTSLQIQSAYTGKGSIAIAEASVRHDAPNRPPISSNVIDGEIHSNANSALDSYWGFLRLSAGGGTNPIYKSFIDISGFSSDPSVHKTIVFGTSGTEQMRINGSGNVGIGTLAPTAKLDVNGQIKSSGRRAAVAVVSATYNATNADEIIIMTTAVSVYLPGSTASNGQIVTVKNASAAAATVWAGGSTTINGSSSAPLSAGATINYIFVSDSSKWYPY